jgi:hypothetical protein
MRGKAGKKTFHRRDAKSAEVKMRPLRLHVFNVRDVLLDYKDPKFFKRSRMAVPMIS